MLSKQIKVAHIGYTKLGGAGIATERLNTALIENGIQSTFINFDDSTFLKTKQNENTLVVNKSICELANSQIDPNNTMFSFSITSLSFKELDSIIENNDIINIHWVPGILSIEAIAYLSHSRKPVVWTFHDINPLTGGCHCFHGCNAWLHDCKRCPQLSNDFDNLPAKILAAKKKYINFKNITVVVLSTHSEKVISQSIYSICNIKIIPHSLDLEIFKLHCKETSKQELKLPLDKKIIFYLPSYNSTIKGAKEFLEALDTLKHKDKYHILVAGQGAKKFTCDDFEITNIGYIKDSEKLALAYSAADVTVVPSLEETFSNTTAESLACGTPVVGFNTGAISDMAIDDYTGYTVEPGDSLGLAKGIVKVLEGPNLSQNCRKYAEENLTLDIYAKNYINLYSKLLSEATKKSNTQIPETFPELVEVRLNIYEEALVLKSKQASQLREYLLKCNNTIEECSDTITNCNNYISSLESQLEHIEKMPILKLIGKRLLRKVKKT
ncbi:glycosyl transferases group 1 family protein [Francisella philomiragia]|uniref:glycosyltransferase n=1 Tax=Francisella philomiragia TaxID=28110 RepID=UPI0005A56A83|nr:glycosyltransferase [Francisella philomiragia]AJI57014.1 glycosyl transferases group 1 family protein [Francisella philomiragia]